jgi:hypothetical protein
MSRAEYMREYRAKRAAQRDFKRSELQAARELFPPASTAEYIAELEKANLMSRDVVAQADALARAERAKREELEDEVRHLKAELAKRADAIERLPQPVNRADAVAIARGGFNTRPFTPVPRERDKAK